MFLLFLKRLALSLVLNFAASLFAPKPKAPKAATLDEFQLPKAREGDELPWHFGTVTIRNAQVAWFGDLRSVAIKEKGGK